MFLSHAVVASLLLSSESVRGPGILALHYVSAVQSQAAGSWPDWVIVALAGWFAAAAAAAVVCGPQYESRAV